MLSTPTKTAVVWHESGYRLAAAKLGVTLRPVSLRDIGLRRYACDVIDYDATDDESPEVCERMAIVMLAGREALNHFMPGANGDRDDVEARDCLLESFMRRHGPEILRIPSLYREFHIVIARLQDKAQALVNEHRDEIARTATRIQRAKPHRTRRTVSQSAP